jgi:signal peptidase II
MLFKNLNNFSFSTLCLGLIGLDQATKYYFASISEAVVLNEGIAFSLAVPLAVTIWISLLVLSIIMYLLFTRKLETNMIWVLFLAGGVGNLMDRVRIGAVIDFIDLGWFPVFNLADIYITFSAIAIIYYYFFKLEKNGKQSS